MAPRITPDLEQPAPDLEQPAPVPPSAGMVRARWVDVQTVFAGEQGIIRYGDPIDVSAEQLAQDSHPTIPWSDDWTPDPKLAAQATQEG